MSLFNLSFSFPVYLSVSLSLTLFLLTSPSIELISQYCTDITITLPLFSSFFTSSLYTDSLHTSSFLSISSSLFINLIPSCCTHVSHHSFFLFVFLSFSVYLSYFYMLCSCLSSLFLQFLFHFIFFSLPLCLSTVIFMTLFALAQSSLFLPPSLFLSSSLYICLIPS